MNPTMLTNCIFFWRLSVEQASTALKVDLENMAGSTAPFKKFDPLGYSQLGTDETLNWFRAAELKNGRVAMLATTGYLVQAAGIHFPGMLSSDVSFESLSGLNPLDQWDAVPEAGTYTHGRKVDDTTRFNSVISPKLV